MYKILKAEMLAENIYLMDVSAPRVAKSCLPGQFVIVKIDEKGERIPLTICDADHDTSGEKKLFLYGIFSIVPIELFSIIDNDLVSLANIDNSSLDIDI